MGCSQEAAGKSWAVSGRCRMWPCGPGRWSRSLPGLGLFRLGQFWGTQSFSSTSPKARLLLQNPPTLLQFPQEEYNVPFKPDLQPSPLPAESRVSGSGRVSLGRGGGSAPGEPALGILHAPRRLLPPSVPRGRGMQQGHGPHARGARPTQTDTGQSGQEGGREDAQRRTPASPRQRQPTRPPKHCARMTSRNPHAGSWGWVSFLTDGETEAQRG